MKLDLIRQMNESIRNKDDYENALIEAGIEFDLGGNDKEELDFNQDLATDDIDSDNDFSTDVEGEYPSDATNDMEDPAGDMDDMASGSSFADGQLDTDVERLIQAYAGDGQIQGTAETMGTDDISDAIGDDLEQLGYSPEEISDGITKALAGLGRGE